MTNFTIILTLRRKKKEEKKQSFTSPYVSNWRLFDFLPVPPNPKLSLSVPNLKKKYIIKFHTVLQYKILSTLKIYGIVKKSSHCQGNWSDFTALSI